MHLKDFVGRISAPLCPPKTRLHVTPKSSPGSRSTPRATPTLPYPPSPPPTASPIVLHHPTPQNPARLFVQNFRTYPDNNFCFMMHKNMYILK